MMRPLFVLLLTMLVTGCRKDKPEPPDETPVEVSQRGVYITNEGNFQWGNASVSYFDPATGAAAEDLYQPANSEALGDVLQQMVLHEGRAYLVLNNSGKVVVVDPSSFTRLATITGFPSPRALLPVGTTKAYVSDLSAGRLSVVDLGSNSITGHIPCGQWTEAMVLVGEEAFITDQSRPFLYVVNTGTDELVDSIAVPRGGNGIVMDAEGLLWMTCSGGNGTGPALLRIDPGTRAVHTTLAFPNSSDHPWRLTTNSDRTLLYFLNEHVYRMPITATQLPTSAFIAATGRNFYGLGVDPNDGTVYVADAIDYVQRGVVLRHAADGSFIGTFHAGRIPGGFVFR
ncbi:MAG: hypothetical protein R2811_14095 [Flavobacteriales bacterium]